MNDLGGNNMSKAILVIDMPSNCKECRFFQEVREEDALGYCKDYKCFFGCSHVGCFIERPKDCPLKPVPKIADYYTDMSTAQSYWADGWNDCLYEILGEQ